MARFDNPQTGAGTLTQRHGLLIGTLAEKVEVVAEQWRAAPDGAERLNHDGWGT